MRTYALILGTCAILGGLFLVYLNYQPAAPPKPQLAHTSLDSNPSATQPSDRLFNRYGEGSRPWVKDFNKLGELSSQYRAEKYLPRKDGTVQLLKPEADFFLGHSQRLHVTGATGDVIIKAAPAAPGPVAATGAAGAPTRGRLNDVIMTLVDDTIPDETARTILTMRTNNIAFDNESFLITTEGFNSPDGAAVSSDQVPVEVRGQYDFDGRGLTLRWNDRDGRLQLLEIAHGEQLTIVHPSGSNSARRPPAASATPSPATAPAPEAPAHPAPVPSVQSPAPAAASPSTQKAADLRPLYLATFQEAVHITQGNQTLITADTMRLHFRQSDQQKKPATAPSSPAPASTSVLAPAPVITVASTDTTVPAPPFKPAALELSATQPAEQPPIVVKWTGKLRIVPEDASPRPLAPGESILELVALKTPVFVHRAPTEESPASQVRCARLLYFTRDGSVALSGSAQFGQVQMIRAAVASPDEDFNTPTRIDADALEYFASDRVAKFTGNGHAAIPLAQRDAANNPAMLDARWTRSADFRFARAKINAKANELSLKRADFAGDVDIRHPQLTLKSQALALLFGGPDLSISATPVNATERLAADRENFTSQSTELSEIIAAQDVRCAIRDNLGKTQSLDAQNLDLHMDRDPAGKLLPRQLDAAGGVHAYDGSQELFAGRLKVLLRAAAKHAATPAPDKSDRATDDQTTAAVELEQLDARDRVKVISKDGSTATSAQLLVVMHADDPHVTLTGDSLARVEDPRHNILSGPTIVIEPKKQLAQVIGPGTLHLAPEVAPTTNPATTRPAAVRPGRATDVIWSDDATLNGPANAIDLVGKVVATMPDADGTINNARCDRMHIDLQPRPSPATKPAVAAAPHRPTASDPAGADLMHDKQASLITLEQNAVIQSRLDDANKMPLREFELKAPRIQYLILPTREIPARTIVVPTAGVMLVRDYRQPDPKARLDAQTGQAQKQGLGTGRGETAFKWSRNLVYSEDAHIANLFGDVVVVHQSDNAKELPVQLNADEMTAVFDRPKPQAPSPSPESPAPDSAMQLKSMQARGNVVVTRGPVQITARQMDYDPPSHWMTAVGSARIPVTLLDEKGNQTTYDQLKWNTDTWDFQLKKAAGQSRTGR